MYSVHDMNAFCAPAAMSLRPSRKHKYWLKSKNEKQIIYLIGFVCEQFPCHLCDPFADKLQPNIIYEGWQAARLAARLIGWPKRWTKNLHFICHKIEIKIHLSRLNW